MDGGVLPLSFLIQCVLHSGESILTRGDDYGVHLHTRWILVLLSNDDDSEVV